MLAFFVIVALSFAVAAMNLTGLVSDYLTEQRQKEDTQAAEQFAETLGPLLHDHFSVNQNELNEKLQEAGANLDGRLLLTDPDGKVQFDSMNRLCGRRLQTEELLRVLTGGKESAYGMHTVDRDTAAMMSGSAEDLNIAYCAHEITGGGKRPGALLYVSRVQKLMDSMNTVRWQLLSMFLIIAAASLVLALILSRVLSNPITSLSKTMRKMGRGDLSVRVPVRGSGELRELAENYNTMAAQLESLDKTRNQFVSDASHELKTPLATMKIMLETMMYQPDMPPELRQEFMNDMNHEIDRLTGIITDLLTITKNDNEKNRLQREPVNMSELTEATVHMLIPAAEKKNQTLAADVAPDLQMMGDRIKLNQVLYNLIDNAIKYSPEGSRTDVSLRQQGPDLVWKVRDQGIGITKANREHIFDRFYRVDKARSRETGGTGLGLSIVKQLVSLHGGTVSVDSEPGKGSEFTVILPRGGEA